MKVLTSIRNKLRNLLQKRAVILMYHQVCKRKTDPWELAVSPERFEEHVVFLKNNFDVVPLDHLATAVLKKNIGTRQVAITFDDGFLDNYTNARAILEAHRLPATFYMATHSLQTGKLFWWDELEILILRTAQLPRDLKTVIAGEFFEFSFYTDDRLTRYLERQIEEWKAGMVVPNERIALFMELWKRIQRLAYAEQCNILRKLRAWANVPEIYCADARIMGVKELTHLGANPLFAVGAHTVHHAMLAEQRLEDQTFEVRQSKNIIENLLNRPVNGFAYPYGNYSGATKSILKDSGFQYAVSTEERPLTDSDDVFALPRMQVKNWTAQELSAHITQLLAYEKA